MGGGGGFFPPPPLRDNLNNSKKIYPNLQRAITKSNSIPLLLQDHHLTHWQIYLSFTLLDESWRPHQELLVYCSTLLITLNELLYLGYKLGIFKDIHNSKVMLFPRRVFNWEMWRQQSFGKENQERLYLVFFITLSKWRIRIIKGKKIELVDNLNEMSCLDRYGFTHERNSNIFKIA